MKALRENLKKPGNEEKLKDYKDRQRIYDQNYMNKIRQSEELAIQHKMKRNESQKKCRERKKNKIIKIDGSAYGTISAKSKAILKVEKAIDKALPKNPVKKAEIEAAISERKRLSVMIPTVSSVPKPRKGFHDIRDLVIEFYSLDIISRQLPGIKDFVLIKNKEGQKEKIQKRVLVMTLGDAHIEFMKMFEDKTISLSKFCSLRPLNVALMSTEIHHSCLCCYCENMKCYLDSLSRFFGLYMDLKELSCKINCDHKNFNCIIGTCDECADLDAILNGMISSEHYDEIICHKEWQKVNGFMQKVCIQNSTVRDVMDKIVQNLSDFKLHFYLKTIQLQVFQDLKRTQPENHATIVVDYAENYTAKVQNELQSSYFARKQISLFTCVAYIGTNSVESFLIVNDNTVHSKEQVFVYLKKIMKNLKTKYIISHVNMFSDGCASQFKNRCSLSNLLYAPLDFGVTMEWNFFATSHGKSSADGIGGIVKRGVHNRVLTGLFEVYTAAEFVECANSFVKKICVFEVDQKEVTDELSMLQNRWKKYKVIQGTQNFHFFKPSEKADYIYAANSSRLDGLKEIKFVKK